MREQVVTLQSHEDHHSARDKMGQARVDRILLVWPKRVRRQPQPLSRKLDLVLMHRHTSRLGAHLGIVTADDQIVDIAGELGLPVFDSVSDAHLFIWRSRRSLRPTFSTTEQEPPDLEAVREHLVARETPEIRTGWPLARDIFVTGLGILAATIMLLLTIPSAEVVLTPTIQNFSITVEVTGDPTLTEADYPNARIPALIETATTSATIDLETTGYADLTTKAAQGTVIFTNLTTQQIRIPAGTAVSTSVGAPVRFVTLQDVVLADNRGMITTALVHAVAAGPEGNVKTALINRVEGPLNQRVAVTNRQPTTGGETVTLPSVTRSDRSRAYNALLTQLRQNGYAEIASTMAPHQFSTLDSAKIQRVTQANYSHFVGEHTDTLSLEMRATVTASVVNNHDAHQAGLHALQKRLGPNTTLHEKTFTQSRSTSIAADQTGTLTFDVTARASAVPSIDPAMVRQTIRWKPVTEARQTLYENLPLSETPAIAIYPRWLPLIPWLEWRTSVNLIPLTTLTTDENIGG